VVGALNEIKAINVYGNSLKMTHHIIPAGVTAGSALPLHSKKNECATAV
jgi:hypothetical protein